MLRTRTRLGTLLAAAAVLLAARGAASAGISSRYNGTETLLPDGNILVAGGQNSAGTQLSDVWVYISTGATSEQRASMLVARASATATLLPNGDVLVTGGVSNATGQANCNSGASAVCNIGEVFDPQANTWTHTVNTMSSPRFNHTATLLPNGKVLISGGESDNILGTVTNTCDLYDPSANQFVACGSLLMARAAHSATLLDDGHVFVAGGYNASGFVDTTELYDPASNTWSAGPALIQARAYHTATQMGNQRVLIAGGYNGVNFKESRGFLETTEIYDPNSATISPGPSMESRKMAMSAVLAGSGKVDLLGGLGNITTSYYTGSLTFDNGSSVHLKAVAGSWTNATLDPGASSLSVDPSITLSEPIDGVVVDGSVDFSSPTIALTDSKVYFDYPGGAVGGLAGHYTASPPPSSAWTPGNLSGQLAISTQTGKAVFFPQKASASDMTTTAGNLKACALSGLCGGSDPATIPADGKTYNLDPAGSSFSGTLIIPLPVTDVGGTVLVGKAIITAGAVSVPSSDLVQGFDVKLTSGIADFSGATVVNDPTSGPGISFGVTFSNLSGTITNTTVTSEGNPISGSGVSVTGITVQAYYVVSRIDVSNQSFTTDIATVAIHKMVFADYEAFTPTSNSWGVVTQAPEPRFNHTTALLPNADEATFGGRTCVDAASCTAGSFTTTGQSALIPEQGYSTVGSAAGALNDARADHTMTLLPNGKVLAAGGHNATDALSSAELYDPTSQTWTRTGSMRTKRSHHTATLLADGTVLAAGGFMTVSLATGATSGADIYYPASGAWVPTSPMLSSRAYHAAVMLPDGNVLVMGGFTNGQDLSSCEVYISTGHVWRSAPSMPEPRSQFTATMLRDGRILVVGGINSTTGVLGSSRLFDPKTWSWSAGPSLNVGRYDHTATLLRDGRVLIAGGDDGNGDIGDAEIYDPVAGTFKRVKEDLGGNAMNETRLRHNAVLLPDGKVLVIGGLTRSGTPAPYDEGFDVDFSTWQLQGAAGQQAGDQAALLLEDNNVLVTGGYNGSSYLTLSEIRYYGESPDAATVSGGLRRRPQISTATPSAIMPGDVLTVKGSNFRGFTEASGGGAGAADSSFFHPRVYLQRAAGGNALSDDSGWMVDLTSAAYLAGVNSWTGIDSSVTFGVPVTSSTLPLGWYEARVAANSQFSEGVFVQVAPPTPTGSPGIPTGLAVGASSIEWTWASAGGSFDGYDVYSATDGVFITTVAPTMGGPVNFIQSGLGPDTSSLIKVAAYNIAGDGQVSVATVAVLTAGSVINGLQGIAQNPSTLFWSWNPVAGALRYDVFAASAGVKSSSTFAATYTQTALSTNTAVGIEVQAIMPGGGGLLSSPATAYTAAAQPVAGTPPFIDITTGSLIAQWAANTNPGGTQYELEFNGSNSSGTVFHVSSITAINQAVSAGIPNTLYTFSVAAENGDGQFTAFTPLGSTYTLANPPINASVTGISPSQISLSWGANSNPSGTAYQVLYSNDNFATNVSTFIPFSVGYTSTTATISPLLTGVLYTVRVTARNNYGQETSAASTQAYTTNGGGPAGSLALLAAATVYSQLDGTFDATHRFTMAVYANTFDADTQIFVTTTTPVGSCTKLSEAVNITDTPALQPKLPVDIAISYLNGEPADIATLGIVRYDPASGNCVPLESTVDTANRLVHARANHFSVYELAQLAPQSQGELGLSRVFPNPFYASREGYVTFDRLPADARVRVYTIHGELLFDEATDASGVVTWRAQNKVGRPVASGIYLAVIESAGQKKIMKLVVLR